MFEGFDKAMEMLTTVKPLTAEMDMMAFMSAIGVIIDTWTAQHELDTDETLKIMEMLPEVARGVHDELGVMTI